MNERWNELESRRVVPSGDARRGLRLISNSFTDSLTAPVPCKFRVRDPFTELLCHAHPGRDAACCRLVADPRLTGFHDPKHAAGRAMARCLGWKRHVAWDTYFVYRPGTLWTELEIPPPAAWFHQLKDREMWEATAEAEVGTGEWTHALAEKSEADPTQFRTGDDLREGLKNALLEAMAPPVPQSRFSQG